MTDYRLILFDIDGTLLKTNGVGRRATAAAMQEVFGTQANIDQHQFSGKTDYFTLIEQLTDLGFDERAVAARLEDFAEAMGRHTTTFIQKGTTTALPGAMEAVHTLRAQPGTIIGLVTGNAPTSARVKLRAAGFDPDWFTVGAFGTESVDRDDLPALALDRARQQCDGRIARQHTYVIGDTVMDIACARAVGAVAIAVRTGFEDPRRLEAASPDHLLDDLTTLFDVI